MAIRKTCQLTDAYKILKKYKRIVWPELKKYLVNPKYPQPFRIPAKYKGDAEKHWEIAKEYPERKGKYLRPTLLLLTAQTMGVDVKKAVKTAAAMQLSEDWLLIHDDIEDDSNMRRGKIALHKIYGIESAINAGDTLHVIMWKILVDNLDLLGMATFTKILQEFNTMLTRTAVGQGIEIYWAGSKKFNLIDDDWYFIADGKTSYYTIAGPMRLGAIIGNVKKEDLDKLAYFGSKLGRCYQLVDDILDITAREYKGQGQIMGNDIYESKKTLLLGHLLRNVGQKDRKRLISILQKKAQQKSVEEVGWVVEKMQTYGSINYAKNLAIKLKEEALAVFETDLKFLRHEPARSNLKTLIHFVLERNC